MISIKVINYRGKDKIYTLIVPKTQRILSEKDNIIKNENKESAEIEIQEGELFKYLKDRALKRSGNNKLITC